SSAPAHAKVRRMSAPNQQSRRGSAAGAPQASARGLARALSGSNDSPAIARSRVLFFQEQNMQKSRIFTDEFEKLFKHPVATIVRFAPLKFGAEIEADSLECARARKGAQDVSTRSGAKSRKRGKNTASKRKTRQKLG